MNRITKRLAIPVAAAAILGTSGFAFMASDGSVATSYAGTGTGTVSGYNVSNIHYTTAPVYGGGDYIKTVTFTLNAAADVSNVGAYLDYTYDNHTPARFTTCSVDLSPANTFTCSETPGNPTQKSVTAESLVKIIISAAQ